MAEPVIQTPAFRLSALFLVFGQGNCYPGRDNNCYPAREWSSNGAGAAPESSFRFAHYRQPAWGLSRAHTLVQGCSGLEVGLAYTPCVHQVGLSPKAGLLEIPGEASLPHPRKVKPSTHTACICTVCSPMCIYELCKPVCEHKGVS